MTKRKINATFLVMVLLCAACCFMSACPQKDKETKYDVTMKIVCQEVLNGRLEGPILDEWIFTPDVSELHTEREYDGKQYRYYLHTYNLPDHPRWSEYWLAPKGEGSDVFHSTTQKYGGKYGEASLKYISEKGEYYLCVEAEGSSWKYRSVYLYIDII